ncbi:RNA polymerase II elongation factor [Puttea exsequens]|nr:RNA polymerase II elongation factor [Puttea exsequens]
MNSKEVVEKSKALQKATVADDPPENIIRILNDLKIGVKADEDLLRSTKIGVIVNKSKQHKDPSVARLANDIVRKWREDISKAKGVSPSDKKSPNGNASPVPSATTNGAPKLNVPPAERDWKKEKVNTNKTHQAQRDGCIGLIYNGLCFMSTAPSSEILAKAVAVEAAGFDKLGPETNPGYSTKMRSLFMNLKSKTNPKLRERVLSGEIAPEKFVTLSAEDLKSEERRLEDAKLEFENMKDSQMPSAERSISSSIRCSNPKCKDRDTVAYTQAQTRSADEPMTTFCECQSCGKRWKFS